MYGECVFPSLAFSSGIKLILNSITHCDCVRHSVAPLCFLYNEPSKLYSVFREMYIRYFFRLHSISSSPSVRSRPRSVSPIDRSIGDAHSPPCSAPTGYRVFVPAVREAAPDTPASAVLPPPADRGAAVSTRCFPLVTNNPKKKTSLYNRWAGVLLFWWMGWTQTPCSGVCWRKHSVRF